MKPPSHALVNTFNPEEALQIGVTLCEKLDRIVSRLKRRFVAGVENFFLVGYKFMIENVLRLMGGFRAGMDNLFFGCSRKLRGNSLRRFFDKFKSIFLELSVFKGKWDWKMGSYIFVPDHFPPRFGLCFDPIFAFTQIKPTPTSTVFFENFERNF